MPAALRSLTSLLLAVLLLGWTSAASSGLISSCLLEDHAVCASTLLSAGESVASTCCDDHAEDGQESPAPAPSNLQDVPQNLSGYPCGCPPDHVHTALSLEMNLPAGLAMLPPVWFIFSAIPLPPILDRSAELPCTIAAIPESAPPGPPPLHETGAPLLI